MKIFLQNCETGKFMRCDSLWTADIGEAMDFLSERRAFFFGMKELKDSFQILKITTERPLPAIIPQLSIPTPPPAHTPRPTRAAPPQKWQPLAGRWRDVHDTGAVTSPLLDLSEKFQNQNSFHHET